MVHVRCGEGGTDELMGDWCGDFETVDDAREFLRALFHTKDVEDHPESVQVFESEAGLIRAFSVGRDVTLTDPWLVEDEEELEEYAELLRR